MLTKYVNKRINVRHLERKPPQNRAKIQVQIYDLYFLQQRKKSFLTII
jgi:hypothetical protein